WPAAARRARSTWQGWRCWRRRSRLCCRWRISPSRCCWRWRPASARCCWPFFCASRRRRGRTPPATGWRWPCASGLLTTLPGCRWGWCRAGAAAGCARSCRMT
ncbi:hypothetical protein AZ034_003838, partial [Pluralibacter gergoviae]